MATAIARVLRPLVRANTRSSFVSAAAAPTLVRCLSVSAGLHSTAYRASAIAAATQPIGKPKPVKEIKGVDLETVTMGAEDGDLSLTEVTKNNNTGSSAQPYLEITVNDVLQAKAKYGNTLHSVKASDKIAIAMQAMNAFNIGAILVTADNDPSKIVGILSTRDFIKHVTDKGKDPRDSKVSDMMTSEPVFTYSDASALQSMTLMNQGGFRHLPVRDRATNKTIGVISIGDLVRTMLAVFKEKNEFLEDMVAGKYPA